MDRWATLLISVAGLILAVPGALVSFRDWRSGHPTQSKSVTDRKRTIAPPAHADRSDEFGSSRPVVVEPASETVSTRPDAPTGSPNVRLSFPRRILASLIDIYAVLGLPSIVAALVDPTSTNAETEEASSGSTVFIVGVIVLIAVYVWFLGRTGRSPGKLLVGGRLERVDVPGATPGIGRAVVHVLVAAILLVISYLVALVRADRRTVHDLASGTVVVRYRRVTQA